MKKTIVFALVGLFFSSSAYCQRDFVPSYYMFNSLLYNPATAGTGEDVNATLMHKSQWSGFETAPGSQLLTAHLPLSHNRIGLGLVALNEDLYSIHALALSLAYSYKIKINKGYLSFGLAAGMKQHITLLHRQSVKDPGDVFLTGVEQRSLVFDNAAGLFFIKKKLTLGFSVTHLFPTWGNSKTVITPVPHYYLLASRDFILNGETSLAPSFLLRKTAVSSLLGDMTCRVKNERYGWAGIGYRTNRELSFLAGIHLNGICRSLRPHLALAYAYDAPLSNGDLYQRGSHELVLLAKFTVLKDPDSIYKTVQPHD